jgi:hypothetical protein
MFQRLNDRQVFLWQKKVKHSKVFYQINREHPAVATLLHKAAEDGLRSWNALRIASICSIEICLRNSSWVLGFASPTNARWLPSSVFIRRR